MNLDSECTKYAWWILAWILKSPLILKQFFLINRVLSEFTLGGDNFAIISGKGQI
jgi:hypothetical protein